MSVKKREISELISEYIVSGEIAPELANWINASEENRRFVESLRSGPDLLESVLSCMENNRNDTGMAWADTLKSIKPQARRSVLPRAHTLLAAGAAAVIAVAVMLLAVPAADEERRHPDISEVVVSPAATSLVKADGSIIVLPAGAANAMIEIGDGLTAGYTDGVLSYPQGVHGAFGDNRVVVARGGTIEIIFPDGTRGRFNSMSDVKFPVAFGRDERRIRLDGEALMDVRRDPSRPFAIDTRSDMTVNVLGTTFNISAYSQHENMSVTLMEGEVEMKCDRFVYLMQPGEHLTYNPAGGGIKVSKAEAEPYIAWTRGELVFQDITLEDAMRQLALYYDIEPVYRNEKAKSVRFGFKLPRYETSAPILDFMELTSGVRFTRSGNKVYIDYK